jgi:hypothetical protein
MPQIPRAFVRHDDVKFVLNETIKQFHHEEKEAIFFYCVLGADVNDISEVTSLTPKHVVSALNLYAERLESKLCFFKKFVPYSREESLPVSELLFADTLA